MPAKKTASEFFRKGREKGSKQWQEGVNGAPVVEKVTPKVTRDYEYERPATRVYDLGRPDGYRLLFLTYRRIHQIHLSGRL